MVELHYGGTSTKFIQQVSHIHGWLLGILISAGSPLRRLAGILSIGKVQDFNDCMCQCGLTYVKSTRFSWTWYNNSQGQPEFWVSRIDCYVTHIGFINS